ncbi:MAG: ferredoxin reductase family protein [Rhizobiaceae bacterium]
MKPVPLIALYVSATLLPLALAWASNNPPRSFLNELASGAGLLAFSIILVEFVLSGRFRSISAQVGMDVTMRFHQLLARSALALAIVHPFLYRGPFAYQKPWDVTRQLTLSTDIGALTTGLFGWVLLPAFILLSIARDQLPYKYETWRLMHGVGALLIAIFVLHHTLNAGRYSQDPALAGVWLVMFGIAVTSLFYVYFVEPIIQRKRAWSVASVNPLGLKTWELSLNPENHLGLKFDAGQFAWIKIGQGALSLNENPFSISSAPASGKRLEFVIKELGDFTSTIGRIKPGTKAYLDGPHGNLTVSGRNEPGIALIAGGVGIAPLLGILRQLHLEEDTRPTVLVYGNRRESQIVYRDELETLINSHGTKVVHVLSEPPDAWSGLTGIVDVHLIKAVFGAREMKNWLYVICGPAGMMESVEDALTDLGVPANRILAERFDYD